MIIMMLMLMLIWKRCCWWWWCWWWCCYWWWWCWWWFGFRLFSFRAPPHMTTKARHLTMLWTEVWRGTKEIFSPCVQPWVSYVSSQILGLQYLVEVITVYNGTKVVSNRTLNDTMKGFHWFSPWRLGCIKGRKPVHNHPQTSKGFRVRS